MVSALCFKTDSLSCCASHSVVSQADALADPSASHAVPCAGYSLTIFIPISLACILPIQVMRWVLIGVGTLTGGLFLLMNFRERIMALGGAKSAPILLLILALHFAFGLVLKLVFFSF